MSEQKHLDLKLIEALAIARADAKIASAKANLALEIIAQEILVDAPLATRENNTTPSANDTFEKIQSEQDPAASIAFASLIGFMRDDPAIKEEYLRQAKVDIERARRKLERTILKDMVKILSHPDSL